MSLGVTDPLPFGNAPCIDILVTQCGWRCPKPWLPLWHFTLFLSPESFYCKSFWHFGTDLDILSHLHLWVASLPSFMSLPMIFNPLPPPSFTIWRSSKRTWPFPLPAPYAWVCLPQLVNKCHLSLPLEISPKDTPVPRCLWNSGTYLMNIHLYLPLRMHHFLSSVFPFANLIL